MKVEIKNLVAHISDIHIRYGSRHEEYRIVFQRTIDDLKDKGVKRIVFSGDLFHIKITLSPNAVILAGWFLEELSKIAPVDIILGNHDLNLQSLDQGNAVEPIIKLLDGGYIIEKGVENIPVHQGVNNGIFFFVHSGFYNIDENIVYGVFSCYDNEMLVLNQEEKQENKKYIALFHGPVYGCRGNNGYELKGDHLMNLSAFDNFDMVLLGDIHEHESFKTKDSEVQNIAYASSLIQQDFSESIEKGYLIWDLDNHTFERCFVENDYGFAKLNISRGELIEERIEELKMSKNPKKTKVSIVWEEYQENYSVEKEKQIERLVKTKFGCETVSVDCQYISKQEEIESLNIDEDADYSDAEEFETLLREFVENSEYDNEEEVIELSNEIDKILDYTSQKGKKWYLDKLEVWNLFSFPNKVTTFDFNNLNGITGIFGKNFNGKSNIIRAVVWILYRKILGGGEAHRLNNMYTGEENAGGKIFLTIDSEKYFIERTIRVRTKKDGTPDVSYGIEYKKLEGLEGEDKKWKSIDSDKAATEKKEKSNIIVESIGTFEDFTKVVLQAQSGEGNFLNMSQQPKNDLINKYLGLEIFRDRYEYAKQIYNEIKSKQKHLGDPKEYEIKIEEEEKLIVENEESIKEYTLEKGETENKVEQIDNKILELTKSITKVEPTKFSTTQEVNNAIEKQKETNQNSSNQIQELETFLSTNFKKELPNEDLDSPSVIESKITDEQSSFISNKESYIKIEKWLSENPKKQELDIEPLNKKVTDIESAISKLNDKLIISKGKKCPTCNSVQQVADVELENKCVEDIKRGQEALEIVKASVLESKNISIHNNNYDKEENRLGALKNTLQTNKLNLDKYKKDLELSKSIFEIKSHNKIVDEKTSSLDSFRKLLINGENDILELEKEIKIIDSNKEFVSKNLTINEEIKEYEFEKKSQRLIVHQLNEKIIDLKSKNSVSNKNIENFKQNLESIKEAEKSYKKYTIYLQAVHRDGIPAKIIKKKLPVINYKINSILRNLVDFKIEILIKDNGDIKEMFYFNSLEKDALPMSMASGAQNFVGSVAIRDSLHFVSTLTKPSLCIIDEGFGSLDDDLTIAMEGVFNYLKNKYKNTWVITHKNEIKDFVDNIIQVSKSQVGLTEEQIEENPNCGISVFDIQNN